MKQIARLAGLMLALPHVFCYRITRGIMGEQRAILDAGERLAAWPGRLGIFVRQAFYRRVLDHVGQDVHLGYMSLLSKTQTRLGDRVYVGRFCTIGWADIGSDARIADAVQILSGRHHHMHAHDNDDGQSQRTDDHEPVFSPVTIGPGAWIGAGAVVMADVGSRAVVGAGAVVVKPVPAGARVAGVPARALYTRPPAAMSMTFNTECNHESG